jgi:hypothetical protein
MTRVGHLLVQDVEGTGVVIVDESSADEVFIPAVHLVGVFEALAHFVRLPPPGRSGITSVSMTEGPD